MALKSAEFYERLLFHGSQTPNFSSSSSLLSLLISHSLHSLSLSLHTFASGFSSLYGTEPKPKLFSTSRKRERAVKVMGKPVKFEGVSEELQKLLEADMDQAGPRRRAREAFKNIQLSIDHILFKLKRGNVNCKRATSCVCLSLQVMEFEMPYEKLKMTESYDVNSRGLEIFSKSWVPDSSSPKAVICYCHGYGDTCTFFFEGIARKLASSGYGVFAMDYAGFGLSEGLHGYIPNFDLIVDDVIEHYSKVKANPEFRHLPSFLFGQSMGGAVALKVHLKQPDSWNGAILVAPMCKLADDVVPPWPLDQILIGMAKLLPKLKLVPQKDLAELSFKDAKKLEQTAYNIVAYKDKPRLRTAVELLRTTQVIEQQLEKVSLPLLILHGQEDKVTDPSVSKELYEKARSQDKTLKLYDYAFHSLLEGETDDLILKVFDDIFNWLDKHC